MKDLVVGALMTAILFWLPNKVGQANFEFGNLGTVKIFKKSNDDIRKFVILVSDSTGWNNTSNELAISIAEEQAVVIGVDRSIYSKNAKLTVSTIPNFTQDLERLAKSVEQLMAQKEFKSPAVIIIKDDIGISEYLAVMSSSDIFDSIASVQGCFTPQTKSVHPNKSLSFFLDEREQCAPLLSWSQKEKVLFEKVADLSLNPQKKKYWNQDMKNIWRKDSRLPASLGKTSEPTSQSIATKLPIIITEPLKATSDHFVVLYSGDGGWAEFTQELASEYRKRGIQVVGMNSLFYFWSPKNPEIAAADLNEILSFYSLKWGLKKFDLVGFSFGADVIPSLVNRISDTNRKMINQAVMIAPGNNVSFEFTIKDWLEDADTGLPIRDEVVKIKNVNMKCIYGDKDRPGVCLNFPKAESTFGLKGGHHFNDDFEQFNHLLW